MKCPICGKDVELQKKQVGTDEQGAPIFNQYAVCRDCRKQWNLDKQRAKKAAAKAASGEERKPEEKVQPVKKSVQKKEDVQPVKKAPVKKKSVSVDERAAGRKQPAAARENSVKKQKAGEETPVRKRPADQVKKQATDVEKQGPKKQVPAKKQAGASEERPIKKRSVKTGESVPTGERTAKKKPARPAEDTPVRRRSSVENEDTKIRRVRKISEAEENEGQRYSNIPDKKVRAKRERAMREGYEEMLAADPNHKPVKKKKVSDDETETSAPAKKKSALARPVEKRAVTKVKEPEYDDYDEYDDYEDDEPKARFRVLRVLLGIASIAGFGFLAYKGVMSGLDNIAAGGTASTGTIYIVLALCMLVSGLLFLIMQKRNTVFAFLVPMIFYIGGAVFAFLKRQGDSMLLYGAIAAAVLGVLCLILAIASRKDDDGYDDSEDYEDPFEDDFE